MFVFTSDVLIPTHVHKVIRACLATLLYVFVGVCTQCIVLKQMYMRTDLHLELGCGSCLVDAVYMRFLLYFW